MHQTINTDMPVAKAMAETPLGYMDSYGYFCQLRYPNTYEKWILDMVEGDLYKEIHPEEVE